MTLKFLSNANTIKFGKSNWLLLVDQFLSGEENMERDKALLDWAAENQDAIPVLRFFRWNIPTVSIGYNQSTEQLNLSLCAELGIPIVRRPTGGRAIYHHTEFTYSITLPAKHELAQMSVLETYNELNAALAMGLREIGIHARLARGDAGTTFRNPSCFSSTSRYELVFNGKKIAGSAQRRLRGACLQQGSIMAGEQYKFLAKIVSKGGEKIKKELDNHSTYIKEILGKIPKYDDFVNAMLKGFGKKFE